MRVNGAEHGVVEQVLRLSFGVGADVEQHEVAFASWHDGRQGRSFSAFHRANFNRASGDQGLGVASRNDRIDFARLQHFQGNHHGGITLGLDYSHRSVVGVNNGGRVSELDALVVEDPIIHRQQTQVILMAHQDEHILWADDAFADSQSRPSDRFSGTEVAAHAV